MNAFSCPDPLISIHGIIQKQVRHSTQLRSLFRPSPILYLHIILPLSPYSQIFVPSCLEIGFGGTMPFGFSLGRGLTGFTLSGSSDGCSVLSGATRPGLGAGRAAFTPFVSSDLGATFTGACRSALGTGFTGVTASGLGAGTARFSGTEFPSNLGAGLPGFSDSITSGFGTGRLLFSG